MNPSFVLAFVSISSAKIFISGFWTSVLLCMLRDICVDLNDIQYCIECTKWVLDFRIYLLQGVENVRHSVLM